MTALTRAQRRYEKAPRGYRLRALQRLQDAMLRRLRYEIRKYGRKPLQLELPL